MAVNCGYKLKACSFQRDVESLPQDEGIRKWAFEELIKS